MKAAGWPRSCLACIKRLRQEYGSIPSGAYHWQRAPTRLANAWTDLPTQRKPSRRRFEKLGTTPWRHRPNNERRWLHGDLHPLNILVSLGRITGVIDWGDLTVGDVATDLAVFWMLFDAPTRERALAAYGRVDNPMRARAMGWAILFGVVLLDTGLMDHPRHAAAGAAILRRVAQNKVQGRPLWSPARNTSSF